MNNNPGYIKLWRKFEDTSFFRDSHCVHLAIYLLIKTNLKTAKTVFNHRAISVHRGECLVGRKKLSDATGISEQSLRTTLRTLADVGFLTIKSTKRFSLIHIVNFDHYQDKPTIKSTIKQPSNNHQTTTSKEGKKGRREEGEEETTTTYPGEVAGASSEPVRAEGKPNPPSGETAEAYIVRMYKQALGIPNDDYDWDMQVGVKCLPYAIKILETFGGEGRYATKWAEDEIIKTKAQLDKVGKDFSLALIAHKALSAKGKWLEEKKNRERYARRN